MTGDLKQFKELSKGIAYEINEHISVLNPTLGDICDFGEQEYYSMVTTICAIPDDFKSVLFDIGIDYSEITDFELFIMMSQQLSQKSTAILLGELDFQKLQPFKSSVNDELVMCDVVDGEPVVVMDRAVYSKLTARIRLMHGIKEPEVRKPSNEETKRALIDHERRRLRRRKNKQFESQLLPMVSGMVNQPGFKYSYETVWGLPVAVFNDSVARVQRFLDYNNLMRGLYAGTISQKDISKDDLNWLG